MSLLRSLAIGLMCLVPTVAFADWTAAQRAEFTNDCISTCSTNPRVIASQKKNCPLFCECYQSGAEQQFPDYAALNRDLGISNLLTIHWLAEIEILAGADNLSRHVASIAIVVNYKLRAISGLVIVFERAIL